MCVYNRKHKGASCQDCLQEPQTFHKQPVRKFGVLMTAQSIISLMCILSQYCAVNYQLCVYIVSVLCSQLSVLCVYCLSIAQSIISYVCILSQYCAVNYQLCVYIVSVLCSQLSVLCVYCLSIVQSDQLCVYIVSVLCSQ